MQGERSWRERRTRISCASGVHIIRFLVHRSNIRSIKRSAWTCRLQYGNGIQILLPSSVFRPYRPLLFKLSQIVKIIHPITDITPPPIPLYAGGSQRAEFQLRQFPLPWMQQISTGFRLQKRTSGNTASLRR